MAAPSLAASGPVVMLAAAVIFGAGVIFLKPLLTRFIRREVALEDAAPISAQWIEILKRHVPITNRLTTEQRRRLLNQARTLVTTCRWEGCGGLVLTEEMQVIIAAQAALLVLELPADAYANLRDILVYPDTFVPRRVADLRKWHLSQESETPLAGEAWNSGSVVVAWDAAQTGGSNPDDGHNTVMHEFAHMLDYQAGLTSRLEPRTGRARDPFVPGSETPQSNRDTWHTLITDSYQRLCSEIEAGEPTVLNDYATTNEQEFFAVVTEVFFEKPAELKAQYPELYAGMKFFYRQDPLLLHP